MHCAYAHLGESLKSSETEPVSNSHITIYKLYGPLVKYIESGVTQSEGD